MELINVTMFDLIECNKCKQTNYSSRSALSEMITACPNCKNTQGLFLKTLSYSDTTKEIPAFEPDTFKFETDGYDGFIDPMQ